MIFGVIKIVMLVKMAELPLTMKVFQANKFTFERDDALLFFLKKNNFLIDITPLNSKARSVVESKLLKEALKHWFVPTDLIREYYGDYVAIYFSWMNFLIKWLAVPGILSLIIAIVNPFYWSYMDSPMNGIYSIIVALWSTLYVIVISFIPL